MRIAVDISEDQLTELTALAEREGVSRVSLIRLAISNLLDSRARAAAFGIWADRKEDSLVIERRLRDEWDREWDTF